MKQWFQFLIGIINPGGGKSIIQAYIAFQFLIGIINPNIRLKYLKSILSFNSS